ncbi:unnamed protein product [Parnassius mnemosyne]|uniref:Uncharacterized protein n=1 Tax=Parnassius mnemosyne TaxID=213953 RepID=A0AAV1KJH5_9NEOP
MPTILRRGNARQVELVGMLELFIYSGTGPPAPVRDVSTSWARKGGGRLFQHRDAANLKEPRNAMVRCFGVVKTRGHSLLVYLLCSWAYSSFRKRTYYVDLKW